MRLVRYNPLNELSLFRNTFDSFFTDHANCSAKSPAWQPAADILNKEDRIELTLDLPGMSKKDIKVSIEDRVLTISGERQYENTDKSEKFYRRERRYGSFKRSFTLSEDLLTEEVDAGFTNGVLKVTLKKNEAKETVKQITVN